MLRCASSAQLLCNLLKLLTYHTHFYYKPLLNYQRPNWSVFFGPPCRYGASSYKLISTMLGKACFVNNAESDS